VKRFGKSESNITAKKPLMVRPSAPRFLNFGDTAELPVVVQNQTDQDMAVDVAIRASTALLSEPGAIATGSTANAVLSVPEEIAIGSTSTPTKADGKRELGKANSREEVRFAISTVSAGTARYQYAVTTGGYPDAAELSLPVGTPATSDDFAT